MKLKFGVSAFACFGLLAVASTALSQQHMFPSSTGYPGRQVAYQGPGGGMPMPAQQAQQAQQAPAMPQGGGEYAGDEYGGCQDGSCGDCGAGCTPRFFVTAEYLNWWVQGRSLPPLVTTSPLDTPQNQAGRLSTITTEVLAGGNRVNDGGKSGFRLTGGLWLDDCQTLAWGGSYWQLDPSNVDYAFNSPAVVGTGLVNQILARPFFNTFLNTEDASLIAYSDLVGVNAPLPINEGSININNHFDAENAETFLMLLWGRDCLGPDRGYRIDLMGGYRYTRLRDSLTIDTFSTSLDPTILTPVGTTTAVNDTFATDNEFHAGQIGVTGEYYRGPWTFTALGKLAVGNMHQQARISGQTTVVTPNPGGSTTVIDQGLLALSSNSGTYSQNRCVVAPELNMNAAYRLTEHLDFTFGYSLLYWNLVATAGNQIDLNINPTLLTPLPSPPANSPSFQFNNDGLWMMGFNVGLNARW